MDMLNVLMKISIWIFYWRWKTIESIQYKKDNIKIQKGFDSEPMYNEEHLKTKINFLQR